MPEAAAYEVLRDGRSGFNQIQYVYICVYKSGIVKSYKCFIKNSILKDDQFEFV